MMTIRQSEQMKLLAEQVRRLECRYDMALQLGLNMPEELITRLRQRYEGTRAAAVAEERGEPMPGHGVVAPLESALRDLERAIRDCEPYLGTVSITLNAARR